MSGSLNWNARRGIHPATLHVPTNVTILRVVPHM